MSYGIYQKGGSLAGVPYMSSGWVWMLLLPQAFGAEAVSSAKWVGGRACAVH